MLTQRVGYELWIRPLIVGPDDDNFQNGTGAE